MVNNMTQIGIKRRKVKQCERKKIRKIVHQQKVDVQLPASANAN
jgi:hypothetical protein